MPITAESLRLQHQLRRQLDKVLDDQTRDLAGAWARGWDEVKADLFDVLVDLLTSDSEGLTRAKLLRSQRLLKALAAITTQLETIAAEAGVRILTDLQDVIDTAGAAQASIIDSQLPPDADQLVDLDAWSRVSDRQIAVIVQRTTEQVTSRMRPLSADADEAVRRELVRAMASGSSARVTARRMVARAEQGFNGGLTRALSVSRTELVDAYRDAAQVAQLEHDDVLAGWTWLATLSPRTCPSCVGMHGTVHDLSVPGPDDHQQGRCARMPTVKPWSELGFDDVEEPPSVLPDADAWFDGLSDAEQRELLGPARHDAWVAGEFPRSAWSRRRSNRGWRDSHVPAPAPSNGGRGGNGAQPPQPKSPDAAGDDEWATRQAALPVDFHGETLEPHEVRFVERFLQSGETIEWIPRGANGTDKDGNPRSTNDFVWVSNDNIEVELKSPKPKYETIRRAIMDAVKAAALHEVPKEHFVIDLGEGPAPAGLLEALKVYNQDRSHYQIRELWVFIGTVLTQIRLDKG